MKKMWYKTANAVKKELKGLNFSSQEINEFLTNLQ